MFGIFEMTIYNSICSISPRTRAFNKLPDTLMSEKNTSTIQCNRTIHFYRNDSLVDNHKIYAQL